MHIENLYVSNICGSGAGGLVSGTVYYQTGVLPGACASCKVLMHSVAMKRLLIFFLFFAPLYLFAQSGIITTYAGNGVNSDSGDGGPATAASINGFVFCSIDTFGNFYFAERGAQKIRKISNTGIISTVAGTGVAGYSGDGGSASIAQFNNPVGVAIDSNGNLYIADLDNNRVRKITVSSGVITTIAGNGIAGHSGDGGIATNASLDGPTGVCVDYEGNVYVSEISSSVIRKISISGIISTYAGIAYSGTDSGDGGPATSATVGAPEGICSDTHGNIFVATAGRIREIFANTGIIISLAGTNTPGYSGDGGPATLSQLNSPFDVAVDKFNNVFIADKDNNRIRYIDDNGIIQSIVGNGVGGFYGDGGEANIAEINSPEGVSLDACGNIYISDLFNFRIRKVIFPKCDYLNIENINLVGSIFSIYPNPFTDELNINNVAAKGQYVLLNITGNTEQTGTLREGSNTIALATLPPGLYLLELVDEAGGKTVSKVIRQ